MNFLPTDIFLRVVRGASLFPVTLDNGDRYGDCGDLYIGKETFTTPVWSSQVICTEATNGYKGGRLSTGLYNGIVTMRHDIDWKVIKLFARNIDLKNIKRPEDIPEEAFALPSDIANPNHDNAFYVEYVEVHPGGGRYSGSGWNYSHCCQTVLNVSGDYDKMMAVLNINDLLTYQLI